MSSGYACPRHVVYVCTGSHCTGAPMVNSVNFNHLIMGGPIMLSTNELIWVVWQTGGVIGLGTINLQIPATRQKILRAAKHGDNYSNGNI